MTTITNSEMLDFLMENDIILKCQDTGNCMTADAVFRLNGEFIVYDNSKVQNDLYRGVDFEEALKCLQGHE